VTISRLLVCGAVLAGCGPGDSGATIGDSPDAAAMTDATAADAVHVADGAPTVDSQDLDAPPDAPCGALAVVYRDFTGAHPDFEEVEARMGDDRGIVAVTLGADDKPVYAHAGGTPTVTGPSTFAQWYTTDPAGTANVEVADQLVLDEDPGTPGLFVYDDSSFFPLNGRGFDTDASVDNFHFTTEIHASFVYRGGELFTFRGDDDLFVFVRDRLVIDLGGVHTPQTATINFDAQAATLGLVRGDSYDLHVFHAERHTEQSNFRIQTTIDCFLPPVD
jgi:fibro-slime domain-containing protein